ncbi:unnamed protein product [Darwinula stevensoni]|uniref:Uncharacterized protein n=1 Tax=Darwinula stevensoni TaxID=69355 RepID=A0A7R9AAF2_9CRUS|nr:unnamed protein product [Darwinula stevensoni]CAG0898107.1 unnamed protein product [Darwinula stevensoni]
MGQFHYKVVIFWAIANHCLAPEAIIRANGIINKHKSGLFVHGTFGTVFEDHIIIPTPTHTKISLVPTRAQAWHERIPTQDGFCADAIPLQMLSAGIDGHLSRLSKLQLCVGGEITRRVLFRQGTEISLSFALPASCRLEGWASGSRHLLQSQQLVNGFLDLRRAIGWDSDNEKYTENAIKRSSESQTDTSRRPEEEDILKFENPVKFAVTTYTSKSTGCIYLLNQQEVESETNEKITRENNYAHHCGSPAEFEDELELPQWPEMLFADNFLLLSHESGVALDFNPLDALKTVNAKDPPLGLHVASAGKWREARHPPSGGHQDLGKLLEVLLAGSERRLSRRSFEKWKVGRGE